MHPQLSLAVAELHRQDLLRDAELRRRASGATFAMPMTPQWRRVAGRTVDAASHALESAARRLDPTVHPTERRLDPVH